MTTRLKRAGIAALTAIFLLQGCAHPYAERGMETFARGMANLVLAPFMIVGGLLQGLAFLPYTIGIALDDLNRSLREAQAVTLDDSYRATFGVASLDDPRVDKRTGEVAGESFGFGQHRPEAMLEATRAFQRLLISQGMPEERARHYAVVGDYTHTRTQGHLLVAVVYRHTGMEPIRVRAKQTGIVATLRPEHMAWRSAYQQDVNGLVIDEVIDWTGIEYAALKRDRVVATLMAIAAESVKSGKRSPEYWEIERRWIAGQSTRIISESAEKVRRALQA